MVSVQSRRDQSEQDPSKRLTLHRDPQVEPGEISRSPGSERYPSRQGSPSRSHPDNTAKGNSLSYRNRHYQGGGHHRMNSRDDALLTSRDSSPDDRSRKRRKRSGGDGDATVRFVRYVLVPTLCFRPGLTPIRRPMCLITDHCQATEDSLTD